MVYKTRRRNKAATPDTKHKTQHTMPRWTPTREELLEMLASADTRRRLSAGARKRKAKKSTKSKKSTKKSKKSTKKKRSRRRLSGGVGTGTRRKSKQTTKKNKTNKTKRKKTKRKYSNNDGTIPKSLKQTYKKKGPRIKSGPNKGKYRLVKKSAKKKKPCKKDKIRRKVTITKKDGTQKTILACRRKKSTLKTKKKKKSPMKKGQRRNPLTGKKTTIALVPAKYRHSEDPHRMKRGLTKRQKTAVRRSVIQQVMTGKALKTPSGETKADLHQKYTVTKSTKQRSAKYMAKAKNAKKSSYTRTSIKRKQRKQSKWQASLQKARRSGAAQFTYTQPKSDKNPNPEPTTYYRHESSAKSATGVPLVYYSKKK